MQDDADILSGEESWSVRGWEKGFGAEEQVGLGRPPDRNGSSGADKLARDSPESAELTKHEGIAMSEGVSRRKVDGRETERL